MLLYLKNLTWNADTSAFGLETSHFLVGSGATVSNASADVGCFHHEFGTSRNPAPPLSFQNNQTQTARGIPTNYSQRSIPTFRASSSLRMGHVTSLDEGLPMVAESYSSRHPRPLSTLGWRNGDRNGRSRISCQRYRSLTEESGLAERFASEVSFASISRNSCFVSVLLERYTFIISGISTTCLCLCINVRDLYMSKHIPYITSQLCRVYKLVC